MQVNDTKKFNFFLQTKIFSNYSELFFGTKVLVAHSYVFDAFLITLPRSFHTMPVDFI